MIYIKSNEYNITNNYNDKVKVKSVKIELLCLADSG